jgi:hypothetical protein
MVIAFYNMCQLWTITKAHDSGINSMAIWDFEECEDPSEPQR